MTHNIHEQTPDQIAFAGDWHGYAQQAQNVLMAARDKEIKHVIQVGDFGVWRDNNHQKFLKRVNETAKMFDIHIYFVDGNHEDFPHLYSYPLAEDGTRTVRSNIHHLPRGFRWNWEGVDFLAMGGAYSVDRKWRTLGHSWFEEELISEDDIRNAFLPHLASGVRTDVLVSHDSPAGAPNPVTDDPARQAEGIRSFGQHAIYEANLHRQVLKSITDIADPALIVHGHYHRHGQKQYVREHTQNLCDVISLDEGAASLYKHTVTVMMNELQLLAHENRQIETN